MSARATDAVRELLVDAKQRGAVVTIHDGTLGSMSCRLSDALGALLDEARFTTQRKVGERAVFLDASPYLEALVETLEGFALAAGVAEGEFDLANAGQPDAFAVLDRVEEAVRRRARRPAQPAEPEPARETRLPAPESMHGACDGFGGTDYPPEPLPGDRS